MITLMVGQVIVQAAILSLILYLVARHEADYSFSKVAMVTAGTTVGSFIIQAMLQDHIGGWSAIPVIGFIAFMLMTFCWISFWKSLIVVAVYIGVHMGFGVLVALLFASLIGGGEVVESSERDEAYEELAKTLEEVVPAELPEEKPLETEDSGGGVSALKLLRKIRPEPTEPDWEAARATVRVGGTMKRGGRRGAMINGQVVLSGEVVTVEHKGHLYRWRLESIRDGMADLKRVRVEAAE
jgi:hypothetical protein